MAGRKPAGAAEGSRLRCRAVNVFLSFRAANQAEPLVGAAGQRDVIQNVCGRGETYAVDDWKVVITIAPGSVTSGEVAPVAGCVVAMIAQSEFPGQCIHAVSMQVARSIALLSSPSTDGCWARGTPVSGWLSLLPVYGAMAKAVIAGPLGGGACCGGVCEARWMALTAL